METIRTLPKKKAMVYLGYAAAQTHLRHPPTSGTVTKTLTDYAVSAIKDNEEVTGRKIKDIYVETFTIPTKFPDLPEHIRNSRMVFVDDDVPMQELEKRITRTIAVVAPANWTDVGPSAPSVVTKSPRAFAYAFTLNMVSHHITEAYNQVVEAGGDSPVGKRDFLEALEVAIAIYERAVELFGKEEAKHLATIGKVYQYLAIALGLEE
jgi:hypothetical protein